MILKRGGDVNFIDPNTDKTMALVVCNHDNRTRLIKLLVDYDFNMNKLVNKYDKEYYVSLYLAVCYYKDLKCLQYLIQLSKEQKFELNVLACDNKGRNGLHLAIVEPTNNINTDVNESTINTRKNESQQQREQTKMVEYLLTKVYFPDNNNLNKIGITGINQTDIANATPLHYAVYTGNVDIVKLLLQYQIGGRYSEYSTTNTNIINKDHQRLNYDAVNRYCSDLGSIISCSLYSQSSLSQAKVNTLRGVFIAPLVISILKQDTASINEIFANTQNNIVIDKINVEEMKVDIPVDSSMISNDYDAGNELIEFSVRSGNVKVLRTVLDCAMRVEKVEDWESFKSVASRILSVKTKMDQNVDNSDTILATQKFVNDLIENGMNKQDFRYMCSAVNYRPFLNNTTFVEQRQPNMTNSKRILDKKCPKTSKLDRWWKGDLLKNGTFATERSGIDDETHESVRLKLIKWKYNNNSKSLGYLTNEIRSLTILSSFKCQNIISLIGYNLNAYNRNILDDNYTGLLIFEHVGFGELSHYLSIVGKFDESMCKRFLSQIINGLKIIHNMNIIHGDLRLENLLIGEKYKIKISNFGYSRMVTGQDGVETDVQSLGVILWKLVNGVDIPCNSRELNWNLTTDATAMKPLFDAWLGSKSFSLHNVTESDWYKSTEDCQDKEYLKIMNDLFGKVQMHNKLSTHQYQLLTQKERDEIRSKLFGYIQNNQTDEFVDYFEKIFGNDDDFETILNTRCNFAANRMTLLMAAVCMKNMTMVETLLEARNYSSSILNVNIGDEKSGMTALHEAIRNGDVQIAGLLLKFGANLDIKSKWDQTSLLFACHQNNVDVLELLEQYKFDFQKLINHRDGITGYTAFLLLCMNGRTKMLEYLVNKFGKIMDILATDNDGNNGLHLAVKHQHFETAKYLLQNVYFPNNNKKNETGFKVINGSTICFEMTPCHIAAENVSKYSLDIFKLLIDYNCDIHSVDENRWLPLHYMCYSKNFDILRYVLDNKMYEQKHLKQETKEGDTALTLLNVSNEGELRQVLSRSSTANTGKDTGKDTDQLETKIDSPRSGMRKSSRRRHTGSNKRKAGSRKRRMFGRKGVAYELHDLIDDPMDNVAVSTVDDDNPYKWRATVLGPRGTPYEDGIFYVDAQIGRDYPNTPPKVTMATRIWHPNINKKGKICIAIFDDWEMNESFSMRDVFEEIIQILKEPDVNDPINVDAAVQYMHDNSAFNEKVRMIIAQTSRTFLHDENQNDNQDDNQDDNKEDDGKIDDHQDETTILTQHQ